MLELLSCLIPYNSIPSYMSLDHYKVCSDHFWQRKEWKYGELNQFSKLTKVELCFKVQNMHTFPFLNAQTDFAEGETGGGVFPAGTKWGVWSESGIWPLDLTWIKKKHLALEMLLNLMNCWKLNDLSQKKSYT